MTVKPLVGPVSSQRLSLKDYWLPSFELLREWRDSEFQTAAQFNMLASQHSLLPNQEAKFRASIVTSQHIHVSNTAMYGNLLRRSLNPSSVLDWKDGNYRKRLLCEQEGCHLFGLTSLHGIERYAALFERGVWVGLELFGSSNVNRWCFACVNPVKFKGQIRFVDHPSFGSAWNHPRSISGHFRVRALLSRIRGIFSSPQFRSHGAPLSTAVGDISDSSAH